MTKHIFCDCKCKFNSTTCNSNKKWIKKIIVQNKKVLMH